MFNRILIELKGEGVFSISGKKHILKAGDIFVLLPNVKYVAMLQQLMSLIKAK